MAVDPVLNWGPGGEQAHAERQGHVGGAGLAEDRDGGIYNSKNP